MNNIYFFFKKYYMEILIFLLSFAVMGSVFLFSNLRYSNDDQFIIYRYIDNIAKGKGFVYNEGEKVLGSTTPLFTLIAALFKYIFNSWNTPNIVAILNIIFISLAFIFLYKISINFIPNNYSFLLVLISVLNLSKIVPEGMESSLFILTSLGFIYFLLKERNYLASIFLALCILTRPDALIIAILAFIYWLKRLGIKKTLRLMIISILITLPWLIFSTLYFGSFIPQSVIAKSYTKYIVNQEYYQALKVQLSHLSRIYWGKIFDPDNIPLQVLINLFPFLYFVWLGFKNYLNKKKWIIFLITILYFIFFSVFNPVMFPWYLTQIEVFWIIISFLGIYSLIKKMGNKFLIGLFLIIIISGPAFFWYNLLTTKSSGTKTALFEIGEYIKNHIQSGEKIGVNNIGIIGYTTDAYIIDFFGLVNEISPAFYPIDKCGDKSVQYQIPSNLIIYFKPDWLVLAGEREITDCFKNSDWFKKNYILVKDSPGLVFKLVKK